MAHLTKRAILKAVNDNRIDLFRVIGHAYFVLSFDTGPVYEERSVYVPRLSDMPVERWVEEAKELIEVGERMVKEHDDDLVRMNNLLFSGRKTND